MRTIFDAKKMCKYNTQIYMQIAVTLCFVIYNVNVFDLISRYMNMWIDSSLILEFWLYNVVSIS